jgi:predicted nuclease with TOPRIM domain
MSFILFYVIKKNFERKEVFLSKSIDQLRFEKSAVIESLSSKEKTVEGLETNLAKMRILNMELNQKSEYLTKEIDALRTVIEALQNQQNLESKDIIIEHYFKPQTV